jgi:predicted metalloendopeptidase
MPSTLVPAMGAVVGHKTTHAFDDKERIGSKSSKTHKWLKNVNIHHGRFAQTSRA